MGYTQVSGKQAEDLACQYLRQRGLKLLERNYNTRYGEIDLVMRDADTTVFVEVRLRQHGGMVDPVSSITPYKQRKLTRTAQYYLQQKRLHALAPTRFDVVAVTEQDTQFHIEWIKNAFEAQGS
ncbi:MAG: YraN family protein [Gammaproteobacteria bacterium]|jgi:putative endonuclease